MNLGASFFGEGTSGPSPTGPLPGGCGSAHWLTSQITSMGGYRPHGGLELGSKYARWSAQ